MTIRVCVLDYGSGNVGSVSNMLSTLTPDVEVSNAPAVIEAASHLVLPGVGAFGASMQKIRARIPLDVLHREVAERGKPFLGICVGFQVLADVGFEFGEHQGLGWIAGDVRLIDAGDLVLPHVGWNSVDIQRDSPLLTGLGDARDFYFVHSYAVHPSDEQHVVGTTTYGVRFCAIGGRDNIHGVQFHPEKSQRAGGLLLKNFLALS